MGQEGSNTKTFIAAAFVIVTGLLALRILLSPQKEGAAPRPAPRAPAEAQSQTRPSGLFADTHEAERLQAELTGRDLAVPKAAGLPELELPAEAPVRDPAVDQALAAAQPQPQPRPQQPAKSAPAPTLSGASQELTEQEKALLEGVGGPKSQEEAVKFGGSGDLMAKVVIKLSKYPRIAGYLLNNDWVVKGFMSRRDVREQCSDSGKLKSFLMDTQNPDGINKALSRAQLLAHGNKEMPVVMASSKLAGAYLSCPSFKGFLGDPASVKEVSTTNPALMTAMTEPEIMQAVMTNPQAMGAFTKMQSGAVGGAAR